MHVDTGPAAGVLKTGGLVGSVEAAPAARIEEQNGAEIACANFEVAQHLLESGAAVRRQTAPALVAIDPYELHVAVAREPDDGFELLA